MAITSNSAASVCLDLSRLISRVGRGRWTGIDRVELAYLRALVDHERPCFGLVRAGRSYFLLDRAGSASLLARLDDTELWGPRDLTSRMFRRHPALRQASLSDLRRLAVRRCRANGVMAMLADICGPGVAYLNVGHANIDARMFEAIKMVPNACLLVLLHDVIPLEFPDYQRAGTVQTFKEKLQAISDCADTVIYPSADCRTTAERHLAALGRVPPGIVAHLGVEVTKPVVAELPGDLQNLRNYFVTLGTIEPRKNHQLLLDVWQCFDADPDAPTLVIAGQRGWNNEDVFGRLDRKPPNVIELNDLSDGAVSALMRNATALLFPSHAEGFGLPPAEAVSIGLPAICSDLRVLREVLGDGAVYLDESDLYAWKMKIKELTTDKAGVSDNAPSDARAQTLPTWQTHFNTVLKLL